MTSMYMTVLKKVVRVTDIYIQIITQQLYVYDSYHHLHKLLKDSTVWLLFYADLVLSHALFYMLRKRFDFYSTHPYSVTGQEKIPSIRSYQWRCNWLECLSNRHCKHRSISKGQAQGANWIILNQFFLNVFNERFKLLIS